VEEFVKASNKFRKTLTEKLQRITLVNSLETTMYDETIKKHQLLQEILTDFYPEGITDIWGKNTCENEWEELQTLDLEKRHTYLTNKTRFTWGEMIDDIQGRLSIYGLYKMKDHHEEENIKILKQAEQLRNNNQRIEALEKKLQ